jgi:hypothetical protein
MGGKERRKMLYSTLGIVSNSGEGHPEVVLTTGVGSWEVNDQGFGTYEVVFTTGEALEKTSYILTRAKTDDGHRYSLFSARRGLRPAIEIQRFTASTSWLALERSGGLIPAWAGTPYTRHVVCEKAQ